MAVQAQDAPDNTGVRVEDAETRQVREVAKELRCAVCQNESVADSNSQLARNMRDLIREQVQKGKSNDEIKAYFVSRYGDYILMEPRTTGFNLVLWIAPFAALLAGVFVLTARARKRREVRRSVASYEEPGRNLDEDTDALIATLRRSTGEEGKNE